MPAITFYRRLGAEPFSDWSTLRLSGDPLRELGTPAQTKSPA